MLIELLPIGSLSHIDEVNDDDASQVPQSHLTGDLLGGRQIDVYCGILLLRGSSCAIATIDIDDMHRLGLLYVQVCSLTVSNDLTEEMLDLTSDVKVIKDGVAPIVKPHYITLARIDEVNVVRHLPHHALIIDIDFLQRGVVRVPEETDHTIGLLVEHLPRLAV